MWTGNKSGLAGKWAKIVALALAAGAAGVTATGAHAADRRDPHRRHERLSDRHPDNPVALEVDIRTGQFRHERHAEPRYDERRVRVWVPPVYKTVCDRAWVEPVYRTVHERVWHEPVVRTECERVWVPARYEERWVTRVDFRGRRVRVCERVCVEPGHFEERRREVVVKAGCWETVHRQELVCAGHWKNVERQELVCAGHYAWRTERMKVADRGPRGSHFALNVGLH